MNPNLWPRVKALFEEVLNLPDERQTHYLKSIAAKDPELAAEVSAMLEARDDSLFKQPLLDWSKLKEDLVCGARIGAYKIMSKLGEGGMGAVYLAERADDAFNQQVAIKVLKRGLDTTEFLQRFHRERRILAGLNHPNIARLLNGGSLENGLPYYVMEHVNGLPITTWCRSQNLDLEQRLNLFRKVCRAVHYAHANLVAHRDLKPCNILVTHEGEPKLLDFGIARVLQEDMDDATIGAHRLPLTPDYASPEQILGEPVATSCDIYALGVILYQLLTDAKPYSLKGMSEQEMRRAVEENNPTPPSKMLISLGSKNAQRAKKLRGELDHMVMMALRKDPNRRYSSALQLAEDITRRQRGLPVIARKETTSYLVGKFISRHRAWAAAVSFAVLLLMTFTLVFMRQMKINKRQQIRAEIERDRANQVVRFMEGAFNNPYHESGREFTASELLEGARRTINWELKDAPDTRLAILDTLGRTYTRMGDYGEARSLLEEAGALLHAESDSQTRISHLLDMGELTLKEGHYSEADALYNEALQLAQSLKDRSLDTAKIRLAQGRLRLSQSDYEQATCAFMDALEIRQEKLGLEHPDVAEAMSALAITASRTGLPDVAEPLYSQALNIILNTYGSHHPKAAFAWKNLAEMELNRGNYHRADALFPRALEIFEDTLGPDHLETAETLHLTAQTRGMLGKYHELPALMERVLDIRIKVQGPEHPRVAITRSHLGIIYNKMGRFEQAEQNLRRAVEIKQALFGPDNLEVGYSLNNLAYALRSLGKLQEAEAAYHRSLKIQRAGLGEHHRNYAEVLANLGGHYLDIGQFKEAAFYYEKGVVMHETYRPLNHPSLSVALAGLGRAQIELGEYGEAEANLQRAASIQLEAMGPCHPKSIEVHSGLGRLYQKTHRLKLAEAHFNTAFEIHQKALGMNHPNTTNRLLEMAEIHLAMGSKRKAEYYSRRALEKSVEIWGPNHESLEPIRKLVYASSHGKQL